jgi:hypothetical protein
MPNRWPISSGNWSTASIWSGSIIPTASDDVFANGQTVNIDTNITVISLRNSSTGSVVANGTFYLNDNVIVTADVIVAISGISTDTIQITGSNSATMIGNLTGGQRRALTLSDNSNISIIGTVTAGAGSSFNGISHNSTGNLTISGSIIGPTTQQSSGVVQINTGNIYVTGSIYGRTTGAGVGGGISSTSTGNIFVNGTITGSFNATSYGILKTVAGNIEVNGNCLSLTGSAINHTSTGTILISGSVTAVSSPAISLTGNSTLQIIGPISSSTTAVGVSSTSTTATNLFTGPFYNTGSFNSVYAYRMQIIEPTSTTWQFDTDTGGSKILYTSNQLPGVPQQTDVRQGIQYNFGLTGSLKMPDPTVVKAGVAVGITTGSAIFTAQDMFNVLTQDITQTGSLGSTLKNAATVQTTAATISAFKV